ncbi:MAG TPA: FtsH protease activity modulator HflK [Candidatus Methylacidiphilales bacterium]
MNQRRNNSLFSAHATLETLRASIRLLALGMIAIVLFYLSSGITVIGPSEVGLVLRFGKLSGDAHPPGLLLAFPPPIDEVIKVPVKSVQEVALDLWSAPGESASAQSLNPISDFYTLTGDVNIIRGRFIVRYQIVDPREYALNAKDRDALRDGILYDAISSVLATMNVEDSMTVRKDYIGQQVMRVAQARIDRLRLGMELSAVEIKEINPPAAVLPSFQAVISAKVQAKTSIEQANTYAAGTIPEAQAEAYRLRQDADSYAKQLVAKAQGESSSFTALLAKYRQNPQIMRARLYGEMVSTVMPKVKVATYAPDGTRIFLEPQKGTAIPNSAATPSYPLPDPIHP